MNMDEMTKREWSNLAQISAGLRFPNVSLQVISPFSHIGRGRISLETFVKSKDKKRLVFFRQTYETTTDSDIFEFITHVKSRFIAEGKTIESDFIFHKNNSIEDIFS
jgi:hypothetical protein